MNIKEFAQYVLDTVKDSAESNETDVNTEMVRYYLDCMEDCDEVSAPEICEFEGLEPNLLLTTIMTKLILWICFYSSIANT